MNTKIILLSIAALTAVTLVTNAQQTSVSASTSATATPGNDANKSASTGMPGAGGGVIGNRYALDPNDEGVMTAVAPRMAQRLQGVVRRSDSGTSPGSIILTSAMAQKDIDELSEDLTVLNFIFARNLERTFGDKGTEYRLGVPITMRDHMVEISYMQDFGVLVKVRVPFLVASSGEVEKKPETVGTVNSDWEKARRAVYGENDPNAIGTATVGGTGYDERLVSELKRQMFDALKNAANVRHLDGNLNITVVVLGGPNSSGRGQFGGGYSGETSSPRATILSIRVSKSQIDDAAKRGAGADELANKATVFAYFDSTAAGRFNGTRLEGASTMGGIGAFGGSYGYSPNPFGR